MELSTFYHKTTRYQRPNIQIMDVINKDTHKRNHVDRNTMPHLAFVEIQMNKQKNRLGPYLENDWYAC